MNIPEPDDLASSYNNLAWNHLNRLAYCGTGKPDPTLNVDPEALLVFIAIVSDQERVRVHPRIITESFSWAKTVQDLLSKPRFEKATQLLCGDEKDQEEIRCKQVKRFIFDDLQEIEEFSFRDKDVRTYESQERKHSVRSNNRLYLRSFVGSSLRAEILNFLYHGGKGNSYQIADCVLAEQSWVYRNLAGLENNGLLSVRKHGRQNIYRWDGELKLPNEESWNNWLEIYDGLLKIHRTTSVSKAGELTENQANYISNQIKNILREKNELPHVDFQSISELPDQFTQFL